MEMQSKRNQLNAKFSSSGKSSRDFIRWAEQYKIKFDEAEVSDWRSGKRRMTKTCQLCFELFFDSFA